MIDKQYQLIVVDVPTIDYRDKEGYCSSASRADKLLLHVLNFMYENYFPFTVFNETKEKRAPVRRSLTALAGATLIHVGVGYVSLALMMIAGM